MSQDVPGSQCILLFRTPSAGLQFSAEEKRKLKAFAKTLAARIGDGRPFTCLITSDEELRRLNRSFLAHDYATDVLSFPALEKDLLGEMAISIERVEAQAVAFGHTRMDEIRILMLHGVLHLTGLDHERDKGEMAKAELEWRAALGLAQTLISRHTCAPNGRRYAQ